VIIDDAPPVVYRSPSVVYRSPTEDAYWNGVWTGRAEAFTAAASAAYGYHKVKEMMEERGEEDGEIGEDGEGGDYGEDGEDGVDFESELSDTRALMRELEAEHKAADALARHIDKPIDGRYCGESAEDDAGDQSVHTTLSFGADGRISGEGDDGVDGVYRIREGRWSQRRVAWIEEYDEGFQVALRGQVRPDGSIVAMWASSLGVGGSVALEAPRFWNE